MVASKSRGERACKRTGGASVPFCGKEERRSERETAFNSENKKSRRERYEVRDDVVEVTLVFRSLSGPQPGVPPEKPRPAGLLFGNSPAGSNPFIKTNKKERR